MKKPTDPDRLENQGSAELTSMLHALRSDGPSRASMQRMAHTLKNTIEAAPPNSGAVRPVSSRMLGKLGVTLLASGALFAAVRHVTHHPREAATALVAQAPAAVEAARPAAQRAEVHVAPEIVARSTPQPELEARPSSASQPEDVAESPHAARARSARHTRAAHVGSDESRTAARVPEPSRAADSASAAQEPAPALDAAGESGRVVAPIADRHAPGAAPLEQHPVQSAASSTPQPAVREPVRVASRSSEASLLQRAQRLAGDQPKEALRILAEHARQYPNGLLAPEREVLAIQILRAQSRTAEASSRLTAFRKHYPDSVYLERLERRTQPMR